jgi:hypothetical protein
LDHKTHHGPDSGEATTFPHIVFYAPHFGDYIQMALFPAPHFGDYIQMALFPAPHFEDYIQMALFPETPKLESRNYPEIVSVGVPRLWELITPYCKV